MLGSERSCPSRVTGGPCCNCQLDDETLETVCCFCGMREKINMDPPLFPARFSHGPYRDDGERSEPSFAEMEYARICGTLHVSLNPDPLGDSASDAVYRLVEETRK